MKVCILLPDYGTELRAWARSVCHKAAQDMARKACPRPWVAKLTPSGKVFLEGFTDYSCPDTGGSRAVMVRFFCDIGEEYLIASPLEKGGARVFKGRITADGKIEEAAGH